MEMSVFVKDYIKSVAGKVLIIGLILLLLTEKCHMILRLCFLFNHITMEECQ